MQKRVCKSVRASVCKSVRAFVCVSACHLSIKAAPVMRLAEGSELGGGGEGDVRMLLLLLLPPPKLSAAKSRALGEGEGKVLPLLLLGSRDWKGVGIVRGGTWGQAEATTQQETS